MASPSEPHRNDHGLHLHFSNFIQSATSNLLSFITPKPPPTAILSSSSSSSAFPSKLLIPFPLSSSQFTPLSPDAPPTGPTQSPAATSRAPGKYGLTPTGFSGAIGRLKGGGPAFVGHVFTMCDRNSTGPGVGLIASYHHLEFPFLPQRAAELAKKVIRALLKTDDHHIFRFFIDLNDAVSYVKRLNLPNGAVGACPLDMAYQCFKDQSHHFQFIPNKKQVKVANKLLKELKELPSSGVSKTVDGVPVFSAQNLDIVIASRDGFNRYIPYFFSKEVLDNILEESVDRHFHSLIEFRHSQRKRDVIDDNATVEAIEESWDDMWEPMEVEDLLDEMGSPGVLLDVVSKVAQMELLHAVDKLLLGNRWLRKATGIQPKFPYVVDSFEKRSTLSLLKASQSPTEINGELPGHLESSKQDVKDDSEYTCAQKPDFRFPFGDWSKHPWLSQLVKQKNSVDSRMKNELQQSVLLPKIRMVGIPDGELGEMAAKKAMEKIEEELDQVPPFYSTNGSNSSLCNQDHAYPLFVANVGDSNISSDIGEVKFRKSSRKKQLKKKKE